jgi:hypothetical protein|tara:strand:- start:1989 stop:2273 length:285 start_codon:yes stop_codon:yes gene_type:complete
MLNRKDIMIKYLSNTLKITGVVAILFFALSVNSKADETSVNNVLNSIKETPQKVSTFIESEVEKTKEYQKNSWSQVKIQLASLKSKLSEIFTSN